MLVGWPRARNLRHVVGESVIPLSGGNLEGAEVCDVVLVNVVVLNRFHTPSVAPLSHPVNPQPADVKYLTLLRKGLTCEKQCDDL